MNYYCKQKNILITSQSFECCTSCTRDYNNTLSAYHCNTLSEMQIRFSLKNTISTFLYDEEFQKFMNVLVSEYKRIKKLERILK